MSLGVGSRWSCSLLLLVASSGCFADDGRGMGGSDTSTSVGTDTDASTTNSGMASSSGQGSESDATTSPTTGSNTSDNSTGPTTGSNTSDPTTTGPTTSDPTTSDPTTSDPTEEPTTGPDPTNSSTTDSDPTTTTDDPSDTNPSTTGDVDCPPLFGDCNNNDDDGCEVNLSNNNLHCGSCEQVCDGICENGDCTQGRYVFVTKDTYYGDFNGLDGADELCSQLAFEAGIPGFYAAWLSTAENQSPAIRFEPSPFPYRLVSGEKVADDFDDLTDGTLDLPIDVDQYGDQIETGDSCQAPMVWSNTKGSGLAENDHDCSGWNSVNANGNIGQPGMVNSLWSQAPCSPRSCNGKNHLYCFQQ